MAEWKPVPQADVDEQVTPADPGDAAPNEPVAVPVEVPEADLLDQLMPAEPETVVAAPSTGSPLHLVPEADALEQAMPADRQVYDEEDY